MVSHKSSATERKQRISSPESASSSEPRTYSIIAIRGLSIRWRSGELDWKDDRERDRVIGDALGSDELLTQGKSFCQHGNPEAGLGKGALLFTRQGPGAGDAERFQDRGV